MLYFKSLRIFTKYCIQVQSVPNKILYPSTKCTKHLNVVFATAVANLRSRLILLRISKSNKEVIYIYVRFNAFDWLFSRPNYTKMVLKIRKRNNHIRLTIWRSVSLFECVEFAFNVPSKTMATEKVQHISNGIVILW